MTHLCCYNFIVHEPIFIIFWQKCGGVERRTDSVPDFCGSALGAMEISVFLAKKISRGQPSWKIFGIVIGGSRAHPLEIF